MSSAHKKLFERCSSVIAKSTPLNEDLVQQVDIKSTISESYMKVFLQKLTSLKCFCDLVFAGIGACSFDGKRAQYISIMTALASSVLGITKTVYKL